MRIQFLGAAGTVTGSKTLVTTARARVLVDCGLFQGLKSLRLRNWAEPPFDPAELDAIVLTHAHIDHSGWLPRLHVAGFRGPVYCTHGTRDLLQVLLPDSGWLQEEQARHANRHRWSKHDPALPLYTRAQAEAALSLLRPVATGAHVRVVDGLHASFQPAGHIIGAASVRLDDAHASIVFSGDLGRLHDPIMRPPAPLPGADALVIESTYGDRRHPQGDVAAELAQVLRETFDRGGAAVVPAFAVGRAQHLLHLVAELRAAGQIPDVPVFLDSPMAIAATQIFLDHRDEHRLSPAQCDAMQRIARTTASPEESKSIDGRSGPMIVISASGMATGGRVLHHLTRFAPDARNTIVLVGFQAAGTRGRALAEGVDELKIHGDYVPVRARVVNLQGLSAHADWAEMLEHVATSGIRPRWVFVQHGEPAAADAMRRRLQERFGWHAVVPADGEVFDLATAH